MTEYIGVNDLIAAGWMAGGAVLLIGGVKLLGLAVGWFAQANFAAVLGRGLARLIGWPLVVVGGLLFAAPFIVIGIQIFVWVAGAFLGALFGAPAFITLVPGELVLMMLAWGAVGMVLHNVGEKLVGPTDLTNP